MVAVRPLVALHGNCGLGAVLGMWEDAGAAWGAKPLEDAMFAALAIDLFPDFPEVRNLHGDHPCP